MTLPSTVADLGSSTGSIQRGHVNLVLDDGAVVVCLGSGGEQVVCDVLYSSSRPLCPGDPVLVWGGGSREDTPVVLGPIGPSRASAPILESQREIPDELVLEATKGLTLKCGEGSITIRADGKILIKGKDLVSHAQRMNRIKGGSVSIN
jgi:hypothetical protein